MRTFRRPSAEELRQFARELSIIATRSPDQRIKELFGPLAAQPETCFSKTTKVHRIKKKTSAEEAHTSIRRAGKVNGYDGASKTRFKP